MNKYIVAILLLLSGLCWAQDNKATLEVAVKLNGRNLFRARPASIEINFSKSFIDDSIYSLKVSTQCELKHKRDEDPVFSESCVKNLAILIEENMKLLVPLKNLIKKKKSLCFQRLFI